MSSIYLSHIKKIQNQMERKNKHALEQFYFLPICQGRRFPGILCFPLGISFIWIQCSSLRYPPLPVGRLELPSLHEGIGDNKLSLLSSNNDGKEILVLPTQTHCFAFHNSSIFFSPTPNSSTTNPAGGFFTPLNFLSFAISQSNTYLFTSVLYILTISLTCLPNSLFIQSLLCRKPRSESNGSGGEGPFNCAASLVAGYPPSKRMGRVRFPGGATLLSEWSSGLRRVTRNHILEMGHKIFEPPTLFDPIILIYLIPLFADIVEVRKSCHFSHLGFFTDWSVFPRKNYSY